MKPVPGRFYQDKLALRELFTRPLEEVFALTLGQGGSPDAQQLGCGESERPGRLAVRAPTSSKLRKLRRGELKEADFPLAGH